MSDINFESELDAILEEYAPDAEQSAAEVPDLDIPELDSLDEEIPQEEIQEAEEAAPESEQEEPVKEKAPKKHIFKNFMKKPAPRKRAAAKEAPQPEVPAEEQPAAAQFHAAPARPQRRPRMSKEEMFKQTTLPLLILATAALLIVIFVIGSVTRAIQKHNIEKEASIAVSESVAEEQARLEAEMQSILAKAEEMADGYNFEGAVALIDTFSGNIGGYPQLQDARARYEYSKESLMPWQDPNTIINLSFQTLIADTDRAFSHEEYGSSLKKNFITVDEFQKIIGIHQT